ncbi:hypothetical protein BDP67DRAFT_91704 [Colletotrichum lupini]|nr:hypothetical protein BDP67DRAFT_91704 [Colletotrichum lupini]
MRLHCGTRGGEQVGSGRKEEGDEGTLRWWRVSLRSSPSPPYVPIHPCLSFADHADGGLRVLFMILSNLSTAIVSVAISTLPLHPLSCLTFAHPPRKSRSCCRRYTAISRLGLFSIRGLVIIPFSSFAQSLVQGKSTPKSDAIATFRHLAFLSPSCRRADLRYRFPTLATYTCGISSLPLHCARILTLVPRRRPYLETPAHCGTSHRLPSPIAPYLVSVHGSTDPTYDCRCLSEPVARLRFYCGALSHCDIVSSLDV